MAEIAIEVLGWSVFVMMITIGMRSRPRDSLHLLRDWKKGARAMAALYIAVPAVAILICILLPMSQAAEVTLIAISVSPMPSMLPNNLQKLGVGRSYAISLEVLAAVCALIAAPAVFILVSHMARVAIWVDPGPLFHAFATGIAMPLGLGLLIRQMFPGQCERYSKPVIRTILLVLLISLGIILWAYRGLLLAQLSPGVILAIIIVTGAGLFIGHALGGPERQSRAALAITAANRDASFAAAVAAAVLPQELATIAGIAMIYLIFGGVIRHPYLTRMTPNSG